MSQGALGIGKIAGIEIELHWLFIALIILFLLISPLFGFIWILLFICVLIHELSHSIVAQRNKIKVSRIILMPIGGASIIDESNIPPKVEFNISIAGPLMSIFLGGLFGIMVLFTPPGIITYIVQYLFIINIFLGVFNFLPAFPMDGGRVLRSYLERKADLYHATLTTAKISRWCMALVIIATIILVAVPDGYGIYQKEIILVTDFIIVFFLYDGMNAELQSVTIRHDTKGLTIKDAILKNYSVVSPALSKNLLLSILKKKRLHTMLARVGSRYELVNMFEKKALDNASRVSDLLIDIPNIEYNTGIADALARIDSSPLRVAAVLKDGKLVGIVTGQHLGAFLNLHMSAKPKR